MKLFCPSCGQLLPGASVNLDTGLGRCEACQNVFDVRKRLTEQERAARKFTPALIPIPARIKIEDRGRDWSLRWRWLTPIHFAMLVFCVAWDAFLIFWYSMALHGDGGMLWIALLFPIAHVAVGVGLTYTMLCGFLNSTIIEKSGAELRVSHRPLPWRGNLALQMRDIAQLYCDVAHNYNGNRTPSMNYALHAILRDGSRVKLVTTSGKDLVIFLEREIERRLGLKDQPVVGEMRTVAL